MNTEELNLTPEYCRLRQQRLIKRLQKLNLEAALLCQAEHVQYLTGFRPHRLMQALVWLTADGKTTLVAPNYPPEIATADETVCFEAQWKCTLRQEQGKQALQSLLQTGELNRKSLRVGVEGSSSSVAQLALQQTGELQCFDLEPDLLQLRRRKDPDELALIRRAISGTEAMYQRAREIIAPGITELEVFNQLHAAVVQSFEEPVTGFGNDFQCNSPGGSPRLRPAQAGELFILDLGPAYRGYYADNCRTFSVDGRPTDFQLQAWEQLVAALTYVEKTVRPGVSASQLYQQVEQMLNRNLPGGFPHHLGHGIGLYPHETPHLNDCWDDTFQPGDVFTAEPGLYAPELKAGIRLEQNYLVTETGVERLTTFPLELA